MIQLIRAYEMDLHGLLMKVMILSPLLLLDIITLIHELREYLRVLRHGYHFIVGVLFSLNPLTFVSLIHTLSHGLIRAMYFVNFS